MSEETNLIMKSSIDNNNNNDVDDDDNDDVILGTEEEQDTILSRQTSVSLVPFVGQRFVSQEAAYEFYCGFAKQCGFSIRRHRTRGKDGVGRGITRRDFTCHRAGYPQVKPNLSSSEDLRLQRNRKSTRCGCQAYMRIVKRAPFDQHGSPEWRVTGFSNAHSHELLKTNQVNLLPAYCPISSDDKTRICMFAKAGMSVRQMLRLLELEKGVKLGCLAFTELDVRNLLQSFRNNLDGDSDNNENNNNNDGTDPIELVSMCKRMKDEDPSFVYDFKIDSRNRLENIAWSYGSSVRSYEMFGDAVVFDTTRRLDGYDMLFGVFVGIDNHGLNCFFGCALLRDENVQSFSWALKAFLEFTKGKFPQTILTDHNTFLKDAIAIEIPRTKHAICIRRIASKFPEWFSATLGSRYDSWRSDFRGLYETLLVEDFDRGWSDMVENYGLLTDRHIIGLYSLRSFWAFAFLRRYFFAGLTGPDQAESVNAFVQRISGAQSQLHRFVHHLAEIIEHKDSVIVSNNDKGLETVSPIESHAASILTCYALSKLRDEIVRAPQFASVMISDGTFHVRHHSQIDGHGRFKVIWLPCQGHVSCSCHHFEFSGFLCRHAIRVLSSNNCFEIPENYLPPRWRTATSALTAMSPTLTERVRFLESTASTLLEESVETEERLNSACEEVSAVLTRIRGLPRGGAIPCGFHGGDQVVLRGNDDDDVDDRDHDHDHDHDHDDGDGIVRFVPRKRRHCVGPCCGQFGHGGGPECQLIGGDHLTGGDGLGYL